MPRDARTPEPEPDVTAADQPPEEQPTDEAGQYRPRSVVPEQADWLELDDAAEADALEQAQPVGDATLPDLPVVSEHDGSEADILEQSMPVPLDEEDERR